MEFESAIISIRDECRDVKTFRFEKPGGLRFSPGDYCLVSLSDSPAFAGVRKPFTFSSSPDAPYAEITVKKAGAFTQALHMCKPAEKLVIAGPTRSPLSFDGHADDIGMIAGGSGITPFMSMVRYADERSLKNQITLVLANRSFEDIIYYRELEKLKKNNFKIIHVLDKSPSGWKGETGIVTADIIAWFVKKPRQRLWLVCGPPLMNKAMRQALSQLGVKEDRIRIEPWEIG